MTLPLKWLESNVFSFLNSFSVESGFVLFAAISLSRLDTLLSKSVFVTKFACANLPLKILAAKVLNFGIVIYVSGSWSVSFFSISIIVVSKSIFLTKLLILGILFSTIVNAVFVAKLHQKFCLLIQWFSRCSLFLVCLVASIRSFIFYFWFICIILNF